MITQHKDLRKASSGMKQSSRKKKYYDFGSRPTKTKVGTQKVRIDRRRSAHQKTRVLVAEVANVYNPKDKTYKKVKIQSVAENKSNRHYARANIITKGAVLNTEIGKVLVTSRPAQDGAINATLQE